MAAGSLKKVNMQNYLVLDHVMPNTHSAFARLVFFLFSSATHFFANSLKQKQLSYKKYTPADRSNHFLATSRFNK